MNTVQVKVPELSESVSEATLLEWKRKPGDIVAADEILIEIETDKVVLEVPSPAAGQLAEIRAQNGQTVVSGEVIAVIDTDASVSASERFSFYRLEQSSVSCTVRGNHCRTACHAVCGRRSCRCRH